MAHGKMDKREKEMGKLPTELLREARASFQNITSWKCREIARILSLSQRGNVRKLKCRIIPRCGLCSEPNVNYYKHKCTTFENI